MRRLVAVVAAVVLVMGLNAPASAATSIQIRYFPANGKSYESGNTWSSNMFGLSLRRDISGPWALSLNYDRGPVSNWTGGGGASGSFNSFFNVNLHRNFPLQNGGWLSAFLGYASANFEDPGFPWFVRQRGIWFGADTRVNLRNNWYVTGSVGFSPRQSGSQQNFNLGGTVVNIPTSLLEYKLGVGWDFAQKWGAEAGYRWVDLRYDPVIMCGGSSNCGLNWSGLYIGVNVRMP